ncbi:MAG: hypothetical protein SV775_19815 [Thermodesulfobacteriota bacterium]|nr:hypothetical protein [Thermodesulfobacteriota bacterium]
MAWSYESEKRYNNFMEEARDLIKSDERAYRATDYPNATRRTTTKQPEIAPISR